MTDMQHLVKTHALLRLGLVVIVDFEYVRERDALLRPGLLERVELLFVVQQDWLTDPALEQEVWQHGEGEDDSGGELEIGLAV